MSAPALDAATDRDDHRFGDSPPLSLGVEEELLLVDERCCLVPAAEQVLEALGPERRGRVSTEIFATQIELKTGICAGADEAASELAGLRRAVRETGIGLLGAGLHPDDDSAPRLVSKPRYDVVKRDLAGVLDTPPCGLHVHVGMPDPETAIQVANALRYHLPLLQALGANSPFRAGADTGLASARSAAVASYPRFEVPRTFSDYDEFLRVADQLIVAAGVADYTYLWWDVRPHPRLGTVEVRGMDVQAGVAGNVAIAALIQALAAKEIDRPSEPGLWREAIEESSFQANRHGLEARLMVDGKTTAPARQLGRQRLAEAGEYARQLGGAGALSEIERILDHGNGADTQRGVHADGGMAGLLAHLAESTS
ncbi:MAG TPA: YbdK family carboxylate-amine ligase [Solirubrobacterales bacterium]|nr:YbdK family carboxylate-amine ligase [Solirubrobacterales bacterium]